MGKRVFICADRKFPRGDAGANRILFIAKALSNRGWKVVVLSTGENEAKYYDKANDAYFYDNVEYFNNTFSKYKIKRIIEHHIFLGKKMIDKLTSKYHISSDDAILLYTSNLMFAQSVVKFANEHNVGLACDIVEWHQSFQFEGKDKSWLYRKTMYPQYKKFFYEVVPQTHNVVVISKCLEAHFKEQGCNTVVVPIYVDSDKLPVELSMDESLEKQTVDLIYPGNPYMKDDFESAIQAINVLPEEKKNIIQFHLTGAPLSAYYASAPTHKDIFDSLMQRGIIKYHSWLEYDQLLKLYECVDFALLPREINLTTEANFPSKVPEMMSRGIPVIMNRVGDVSEYLTDNFDAILYDDEGAEACGSALARVMQLDIYQKRAMKKNALDSAKIKFNYHLCEENLDNFFSKLER